MPRAIIPKNAGRDFSIVTSHAGTPLLGNGKTGKNKVRIPCRNQKQAEELCEKLKQDDHNGEIWY